MSLITKIAIYSIAGMPLFIILGILAFISLLATAVISFLNMRGIHIIPFKWHPRLAAISIIIAFIHGVMALFVLYGL